MSKIVREGLFLIGDYNFFLTTAESMLYSSMDLSQQITMKVAESVKILNTILGKNYPIPPIHYFFKGTRGGFYHHTTKTVHYNGVLAAQNAEHFLKTTVPHEVAHYIQFMEYGPRVQPHGTEWKQMMRLLGCDPIRCHSYDVAAVKQRHVKRYAISCQCKTYQVTSNLIKRRNLLNPSVKCRRCGANFKLVE